MLIDIRADVAIEQLSSHLISNSLITTPANFHLLKSSCGNERPAQCKNFLEIRVSAIMRKLYLSEDAQLDFNQLRSRFGTKKNRGVRPSRHVRGSKHIICVALKEMEKNGWCEIEASKIKQTEKGREFIKELIN